MHRPGRSGRSHGNLREQIAGAKLCDEKAVVNELIEAFPLGSDLQRRALEEGQELVRRARDQRADRSRLDAFLEAFLEAVLDAFLEEYGLSNEEGVALMCLAEALLCIPDDSTADAFVSEKVLFGDWAADLGGSDAPLVNASTWVLMLTGRAITPTAA